MKKLLLLTFLIILCTGIQAQYSNLKFENYSTAAGLSSSTCVEIFQDSDGFMWFGTIDGLNQYNGYEFTIYRPVKGDSHSISSNRITAITEDQKGRLWIGTENGLNLFNKGSRKFYRYFHENEVHGSLSNNVINDVYFNKASNELWVATQNGLNKLNLEKYKDLIKPPENAFKRYYHKPSNKHSIDNNEVKVITEDNAENIWAVTAGNNLNRYKPGKDWFIRTSINIANTNSLGHLPKRVLVDQSGDFWLGNNLSEIIFWDRDRDTFRKKSFADKDIPIFDLYQDKKGIIWIATDGHGLYFVQKKQGITKHLTHNPSDPFSLPNNQPSKILEDENGIFWIASYNKGVSKLALSKSAFGHYYYQEGKNSLSTKIAQSVLQDTKGRIWIGTDGGGLNLFDEADNYFYHFRHDSNDPNTLSTDKILYLEESYDGSIWVCTWDAGLNKFNPENKRVTRYKHDPSDPYSIGGNTVSYAVEDSLKRLWIATRSAGLNLFDPDTERFYEYLHNPEDTTSLISDVVFSLSIDSQNRLLVGTSQGLCMVNLDHLTHKIPEKINFKNIARKSLQGNRINYITEDRRGNIWVGTDLGIYKLNPNLKLQRTYTTQDGLPNNLVVGLTEDEKGHIWITSKSGLSRLDPQTHNIKNYNIHDGIQGMEFQSRSIDKTNDGRIIIGGINGFNLFDPEDIVKNVQTPKPVLTDFLVYNNKVNAQDTINGRVLLEKNISNTDEITLTHQEDYVAFEFVALNYENPERVNYAYKLNGLDEQWNYVGKIRNASYSNLAGGDYTFEVMTSVDGNWDDAKKSSLTIHVLPPPWKTWWAYSFYAAFIIGGFWIGIRYYTKMIKREKEHETDQMKLRFFINVSHEFKTPLTLVLNPIEKILSSPSDPEVVKTSAQTIQRSARRLLNLVNQLLEFRKIDLGKTTLEPVRGDMVKFSKDIFMLFNDLAELKHIHFKFEKKVKRLIAWFDPDKVEKIITNLLSNALKFTPEGGTVIISVARVSLNKNNGIPTIFHKNNIEEYAEITIEDTGIGFQKDKTKDVFDRFFHEDKSNTGTGIGLNFTKTLVEMHGGEILVESEYQKGSKFIVRLPVYKNKTQNTAQPGNDFARQQYEFNINAIKSAEYELAISGENEEEDHNVSKNTNGDFHKPEVLIVDDNKELRCHLKHELKAQYNVREAVNGAEGLEKALKVYPDIIISDIMMPEMDGFEFCRRLKSTLETSHLPVILLTARTLEEDKIEGYKTGADEYLPKPFNVNVLRARIENLLASQKRLKEKFSSGSLLPSSEYTSNSLDEALLDGATNIIIENISNPDFTLDNLLKEMGMSRAQFYRKINSLTGQNPSYFIRTVRLKYASELLAQNKYTVKEVAYMTGFNSTAYFSKTFRECFGQTPNQYVNTSLNNN